MSEEPTLFCYIHPDRKTLLRCNKCERPICSSCAVLTPTGYRCKECIRSQQKIFDTAQTGDYIIAPLLAAGISFMGSFLPSFLGFFTLFLAPLTGMIIVESTRWLTHKRRSILLVRLITAAALIGSLPLLFPAVYRLILLTGMGSSFSLFNLLPLIWQVIYTLFMVSSVYYRLAGIRVG